jgi:hypothetical protein
VKIWTLIILLLISGFAYSQEEDTDTPEEPINWVDDSHVYATNRAQALTQWMDDFFGDPLNDLEQAESFLRMHFIDDWDGDDGHDFKVRLRGKVQLPKISQRLDLVFSGSEEEHVDEDEREDEDSLSLQYNLSEGSKSRFDLTLGWASSNVRPGVRYRNEGSIGNVSSYRFLERLQWEDGEGVFSTSQIDLYRVQANDDLLRWSGRIKYGEETDGIEWRSKWALSQRYLEDTKRPIATNTFLTINGVTQREDYTKNYKLGFLFRRQMYRDFLFVELEPAYNYRRLEYEDERAGVWSLVVRLEIVLEKDLRRRNADSDESAQSKKTTDVVIE